MKNFLTLGIVFVLTAALAGVYAFAYTNVASGIVRAQTALSQSETLSERDALVRSQQQFLESVVEDRDTLNNFIAQDDNVVAAIEIVEDTARQERVSVAISNITTQEGDGWGYHEKVAVSFSASGTFQNILRFMSALETLPIASTLDQGGLEVQSSGWFGTFTVSFVKNK